MAAAYQRNGSVAAWLNGESVGVKRRHKRRQMAGINKAIGGRRTTVSASSSDDDGEEMTDK